MKIQKYGSNNLPIDLWDVEISSAEEALELSRRSGVAVEFDGVVYAGGKEFVAPFRSFPQWPGDKALWD